MSEICNDDKLAQCSRLEVNFTALSSVNHFMQTIHRHPEAATESVLYKNLFLEISQYLQKKQLC